MQNVPVTQSLPTAAVVATHEVESFDAWKLAFDGHRAARQAAGIFTTHVNRDVRNPNRISVYLGATNREKLTTFLSSTGLMATMHEAGVKGPPHIALIDPVEDRTVKDRPLPGVIVRHEVRDFDTWKRAFDAHASERARGGIVGYAVNRSVQNPNVVIAYLQAESLQALETFAKSPSLQQAMQSGGVVGAPDVSFVEGGEWAS